MRPTNRTLLGRVLVTAVSVVTGVLTLGAFRNDADASVEPPRPRAEAEPSGHTLDGLGGVHGWGERHGPYVGAYWPHWDIARGIASLDARDAGYVIDGYGGLHAFARAGDARPEALDARFPGQLPYWLGWDIARDVVLWPGADGPTGGYVLDGWGGVHPFGSAPDVVGADYFPGVDVARGLFLRRDPGTGAPAGLFWTDGRGAIHRVDLAGVATEAFDGRPRTHADVWRDVAVLDDASGEGTALLLMSRRGEFRAIGDAALPAGAPYWPLWDIAVAFDLDVAAA